MAERTRRRDGARLDLSDSSNWSSARLTLPSSPVIWRHGRFRFHRSGIPTVLVLAALTALPLLATREGPSGPPPGVVSAVPHSNPLPGLLLALVIGLGWGHTVAIAHHELAHALVARRYGVQTSSFGFHGFGGYVVFDTDAPTWRTAAWISAAGPLSNAVVGIGLLVLWAATGGGNDHALGILLVVAGSWELTVAAVNLVPHDGSDGREILDALRAGRANGARNTVRR